MNFDDYQLFEIPLGGRYRLIPEEDLKDVADALLLMEALNVPSLDQVTIGLLIKQNRTSRRMTVQDLSDQVGVKVRQIHAIEADQVDKPQRRTLNALVSVFGRGFWLGLRAIGLEAAQPMEN